MDDDLFKQKLATMMDRILYEFGGYGVCLVVVRDASGTWGKSGDKRIEFVSNMCAADVRESLRALSKEDDGFKEEGIYIP